MLTAKYKDELINCYDGILRKEVLKQYHRDGMLFCPVCDAPYMYCHGDVNTPYFKHKNSTECTRFSEPESPEHFKGKVALYNWIKGMDGVTNARLEHWIPATNQRPDIAFRYNDDPYVIEYQCTPISGEYRERHKLYSELDITDIWICGTEKYFDKEGCDSITASAVMTLECQLWETILFLANFFLF